MVWICLGLSIGVGRLVGTQERGGAASRLKLPRWVTSPVSQPFFRTPKVDSTYLSVDLSLGALAAGAEYGIERLVVVVVVVESLTS